MKELSSIISVILLACSFNAISDCVDVNGAGGEQFCSSGTGDNFKCTDTLGG